MERGRFLSVSLTIALAQVIALFAMAHSRAANIYLCSRAVNLLRPPDMGVPESHQASRSDAESWNFSRQLGWGAVAVCALLTQHRCAVAGHRACPAGLHLAHFCLSTHHDLLTWSWLTCRPCCGGRGFGAPSHSRCRCRRCRTCPVSFVASCYQPAALKPIVTKSQRTTAAASLSCDGMLLSTATCLVCSREAFVGHQIVPADISEVSEMSSPPGPAFCRRQGGGDADVHLLHHSDHGAGQWRRLRAPHRPPAPALPGWPLQVRYGTSQGCLEESRSGTALPVCSSCARHVCLPRAILQSCTCSQISGRLPVERRHILHTGAQAIPISGQPER